MGKKELLELMGKNIVKFRKAKGLTVTELGYKCDIEKNNLIPIEKGRVNVTVSTLHKIAWALEIDVADLFKPVK